MSLDGLEDLDIWDSWWEKVQESATEKKEKAAKAAKAMAWIQKTRKDEKKAQKDNDFLYEIVIDIIQNPKYDILIPFISELLRNTIPSNLIIGWISLIYNEATYIIRSNYLPWKTSMVLDKKQAQQFKININYQPTQEIIEFNDDNTHEAIKWRINEWIEDIISVVSFDPSSIVTNKFLRLIEEDANKNLIINYLAWVLTFFLFEYNISISKEKAFLYAKFVLWEAVKKMKTLKVDEELM